MMSDQPPEGRRKANPYNLYVFENLNVWCFFQELMPSSSSVQATNAFIYFLQISFDAVAFLPSINLVCER